MWTLGETELSALRLSLAVALRAGAVEVPRLIIDSVSVEGARSRIHAIIISVAPKRLE